MFPTLMIPTMRSKGKKLSFKFFLLFTLGFLGTTSFFSYESLAEGIKIIDCQGRTRAMKQSQEVGELQSRVKIEVIAASGAAVDGVALTLQNGKGEKLRASSEDGVVEFPNVPQGVWMVTAEENGFFFTSISLSDSIVPAFWERTGDFLLETGKIVLVTGAIVGAALLVDEVSDGDSGGEEETISPPPSSGCASCNPDAVAPSIPAFQ